MTESGAVRHVVDGLFGVVSGAGLHWKTEGQPPSPQTVQVLTTANALGQGAKALAQQGTAKLVGAASTGIVARVAAREATRASARAVGTAVAGQTSAKALGTVTGEGLKRILTAQSTAGIGVHCGQ
jgi:hypothetical protein